MQQAQLYNPPGKRKLDRKRKFYAEEQTSIYRKREGTKQNPHQKVTRAFCK